MLAFWRCAMIGAMGIWLAVCLWGCADEPQFNPHPSLLLSAAEITEIKQKLHLSPWREAFEQVRLRADKALQQSPTPVRGDYPLDKKPPRAHYKAANRDANRALDLALAYQFSGELPYANQARNFVMAWVESMDTDIDGYQAGIELSITMPQLLWAADLIWFSGQLSVRDQSKIQSWARDLGRSAIEAQRFCCGDTHNIHNWEWFLVSAAGVMANDRDLFDYGVSQFKTVLPRRFEANQLLKSEGERTFEYAWFGLKALTMLAELARHQGIDLYDFEVDGLSLYHVSKAHTLWFLDRNYPGKEPNYDLVIKEELDLVEIWHSRWGDEVFKAALQIRGRPAYDPFVLGPVTLTHGERTLNNEKPRSKITH